MCLFLESVDETFLSGVVAFGGLLCVVAEEGSVGSVLKMSVFIQTMAHDVLLLFSNIAWFPSSVVVHACGNYAGSVGMSSVFAIPMSASGLTPSSIWWTSFPDIMRVFSCNGNNPEGL